MTANNRTIWSDKWEDEDSESVGENSVGLFIEFLEDPEREAHMVEYGKSLAAKKLSKSDDLDKLMILEDTIENLMKDGPKREYLKPNETAPEGLREYRGKKANVRYYIPSEGSSRGEESTADTTLEPEGEREVDVVAPPDPQIVDFGGELPESKNIGWHTLASTIEIQELGQGGWLGLPVDIEFVAKKRLELRQGIKVPSMADWPLKFSAWYIDHNGNPTHTPFSAKYDSQTQEYVTQPHQRNPNRVDSFTELANIDEGADFIEEYSKAQMAHNPKPVSRVNGNAAFTKEELIDYLTGTWTDSDGKEHPNVKFGVTKKDQKPNTQVTMRPISDMNALTTQSGTSNGNMLLELLYKTLNGVEANEALERPFPNGEAFVPKKHVKLIENIRLTLGSGTGAIADCRPWINTVTLHDIFQREMDLEKRYHDKREEQYSGEGVPDSNPFELAYGPHGLAAMQTVLHELGHLVHTGNQRVLQDWTGIGHGTASMRSAELLGQEEPWNPDNNTFSADIAKYHGALWEAIYEEAIRVSTDRTNEVRKANNLSPISQNQFADSHQSDRDGEYRVNAGFVSYYGMKNSHEFFAECYTAFFTNTEWLRQHNPTAYEFMSVLNGTSEHEGKPNNIVRLNRDAIVGQDMFGKGITALDKLSNDGRDAYDRIMAADTGDGKPRPRRPIRKSYMEEQFIYKDDDDDGNSLVFMDSTDITIPFGSGMEINLMPYDDGMLENKPESKDLSKLLNLEKAIKYLVDNEG